MKTQPHQPRAMSNRKFNLPTQTPDPESRTVRTARLQKQRRDKAIADLGRWTSKLKRAAKQVAKLRTRVKYYEALKFSVEVEALLNPPNTPTP